MVLNANPAFQLLKEHLKQYTADWAEKESTVPARTIQRIAREFVEEARIGSTIEIEGVKLPYRPVASAMFRGGTRAQQFLPSVRIHLLY